jgi:hypothetical protein
MPDPGWHRAVGDPECFLTYAGGTMHPTFRTFLCYVSHF